MGQTHRPRQPGHPELTFSLQAWLKLQYLCHQGPTEVGAFGISHSDRLLSVEDLVLVRQHCSEVSVEFEDEAVADFFDEQIDDGRRPDQFGRIWLHTHPGDSPHPSSLDEETFNRAFGRCDWAVMFILARGGETFCRLCVNTAPSPPGTGTSASRLSLNSSIPVRVNYGTFSDSDLLLPVETWREEYEDNVLIDTDVSSVLDPRIVGERGARLIDAGSLLDTDGRSVRLDELSDADWDLVLADDALDRSGAAGSEAANPGKEVADED